MTTTEHLEPSASFVPALGKKAFTRFYDTFIKLTLREARLRDRLIRQAKIAPAHRVLDFGCGTAALSILIKQRYPRATLTGLDIDPEILAIARRKAARRRIELELVRGSVTDPPFAPGSFDRVISMLVLHHLSTDDKQRAFRAARELLAPGGELHIADFGKPRTRWAWTAFQIVRRFDGKAVTEANFRGELPALMRAAGFSDVAQMGFEPTVYGTLWYFRARIG